MEKTVNTAWYARKCALGVLTCCVTELALLMLSAALTLCGVMAALVFVMTYFPKIPVPVTGGYVHLGDGAIFLSVLLLGPLGIPAAAVGSMLSDLIGGYMVYVLPTFLIKGLVALVAWKLCRKDQPLLALLSFLLAEAVMVLGYFLLEWAVRRCIGRASRAC